MGEDDPVDALYACAPNEFVAARNTLERRLRAARDKAGADQVRSLRRPTRAAWLLNRLSSAHPQIVDQLLRSGLTLRSAMESAVAGEGSGLRPARAAERAAVRAALVAIQGQCEETGQAFSESLRSTVTTTMQAALVRSDVGEALRAGRLDADHEAPGWGLDLDSLPLPATATATATTAATTTTAAATAVPAAPVVPAGADPEEDRRDQLQDVVDRLTGRATRVSKEADEARVSAVVGRRLASEAEDRFVEASRTAESAARSADEAERAARRLEAEAAMVSAAVEVAQRQLMEAGQQPETGPRGSSGRTASPPVEG